MPRIRLTIAGLVSAAILARFAAAQSDDVASRPRDTLPPELAQIDDFSFSYAQPGFYAVLTHVKRTGVAALSDSEPLPIADWRDLLERSADYRGRSVTIEGIVGRNSPWKPLDPQHQSLGTVWELQLHRDDQPLICKCILVGDAGDIPIGARIELTGVYVMIQQYYSESKRLRHAALLVGVGPTKVSQAAPHKPNPARENWVGVVLALAAGLILAWVLLRRHMASRPPLDHRELRAENAAPLHLADDLAAWARRDNEAFQSPDKPGRE